MLVLTGSTFLQPQGLWALASRDQAGGVLSFAAVPRGGLGPLPPPLCRCAVHTKRPGSERGGRAAVQYPQCWQIVSALAVVAHHTASTVSLALENPPPSQDLVGGALSVAA